LAGQLQIFHQVREGAEKDGIASIERRLCQTER
jgi:hypothetical protein